MLTIVDHIISAVIIGLAAIFNIYNDLVHS